MSSPLTLIGTSATFEATVQIAVTDGDGRIIYEGFFTSTGANGAWGPFEETIELEDAVPGLGSVSLWEEDMSGEAPDPRLHLVEVPLRFG